MALTTATFKKIWDSHPYPETPCDANTFLNQCAIRMGVALEKAGCDTSGFDKMFPKRRCWVKHEGASKHILAAHELAKWMSANPSIFGIKKTLISISDRNSIIKGANGPSSKGKKGIVYVSNGWGAVDHIDLWDGEDMRAGDARYLHYGDALWFWEAN